MEDTISRKKAIEAMEDVDWYHINKDGQLTHGANSKEDEPLYKAKDVYKVLNDMPSAQPETHDKRTKTHACDLINRQAALDALTRKMVSIPTAGEKDLMGDVNRIRAEDISAIRRLPSAQPEHTNSWYINSWCNNCKEYDKAKHSCPRFNRVIKQTIDEIYSHAEIVRCKDCRFYKSDGCFFSTAETSDDGFCYWAERRTE